MPASETSIRETFPKVEGEVRICAVSAENQSETEIGIGSGSGRAVEKEGRAAAG